MRPLTWTASKARTPLFCSSYCIFLSDWTTETSLCFYNFKTRNFGPFFVKLLQWNPPERPPRALKRPPNQNPNWFTPPSVKLLSVKLPISDHRSPTSRAVAYVRFHCMALIDRQCLKCGLVPCDYWRSCQVHLSLVWFFVSCTWLSPKICINTNVLTKAHGEKTCWRP